MKKNVFIKGLMTVALVTPLVSGCSKGLDVKKDMSVELGTPISTNIKDYLNENAKDQDKILKDGKLSIVEDKKVEGKDYQPIGDYTVKITYDGKESEVKVSVKDTVKPVFKEFKDTIDTYKDVKVDFAKVYVAEDLSKVTISADDSKVDYTKEGSYKATVSATDEGKNTETKEVTINVKKPEIKLDKTSQTMYEKESFVLKVDVKGKEAKPTFKSSNTNIVTVSEDGKVIAKKKGTATITVSANGVEAICKVTVKSVPKGSSTTTQTIKNPTTGKNETVTIVKPSKPSGPSSESSETPAASKINKNILDLLNKERNIKGLKPLNWNPSLDEYAKTRAKEISIKFSHSRPNGGSGAMDIPIDCSFGGEILAKTNTAQTAVKGWMNSEGHRRAILNGDYTSCSCAQYGRYWVVIFVG